MQGSETPSASGSRIGGYQVLERIGEGGFADVFRATGPDGREVALKRFRAPLPDLDAARRDARLQAQQAWQAASTGARRVAALNTALRSADLQQSAAATGRDVGIRTQNDVLNAQSQSFATDRDRAQAVYDYILARLKLAASTGDLGFEELDEADRLMTSIRPETRP